MANIRPPTRTPGSLKLLYKHAGLDHKMTVNLLANVDINDFVARRGDANQLADLVADVVPNSVTIGGWGLYTRPGVGTPPQLIYQESFPNGIIGAAAPVTGYRDYNSNTVTLTGRGTPGGPGYAAGEMRLVVFCGIAIRPEPGEKSRPIANLTSDWVLLQQFLDSSPNLWADFYGQKGHTRPLAPLQFNAHVQRVHGT